MVFDFSRGIGAFALPCELRAKEVNKHQDDGARDLEEMLEGHQRMNQDIVQVKRSQCFSNTSGKVTLRGNLLIYFPI